MNNNTLQMMALACLMRTLMEESETHFLESLSIFCQHLVWDSVHDQHGKWFMAGGSTHPGIVIGSPDRFGDLRGNEPLPCLHSQGLLIRSNLQACKSHEYPCPCRAEDWGQIANILNSPQKQNVCPLFHQVFARVLNKYSPDTGTPGWMILYPGPDFSETHLSCCFR